MKKTISIISIFILFTFNALASVGVIERYSGEAYVLRGNKKIDVVRALKLERKDIITTKKNAWVKIKLNDNTLITAGKNAKLVIDDYLYDGKRKAKASFSFSKGVFKTITGAVGKISPKKFKVHTPNATIGIRGTEFYVDASRPQEHIICTRGTITVTSSFGEVEVEAGRETFAQSKQKPQTPTKANQQNIFKIDLAIGIHHPTATHEERTLIEKSEGGLIKPLIQSIPVNTPNIEPVVSENTAEEETSTNIEESTSVEESSSVEDTIQEEVTTHETTDEIKDTAPVIPIHNPCPLPPSR